MNMFEYVMVLVSIIVGLALSHLLQGLVDLGLLEFGGMFRSWGEVVHGVNNGV